MRNGNTYANKNKKIVSIYQRGLQIAGYGQQIEQSAGINEEMAAAVVASLRVIRHEATVKIDAIRIHLNNLGNAQRVLMAGGVVSLIEKLNENDLAYEIYRFFGGMPLPASLNINAAGPKRTQN